MLKSHLSLEDDFERELKAGLADVPVLAVIIVLKQHEQVRYVNIRVIVTHTKPPAST